MQPLREGRAVYSKFYRLYCFDGASRVISAEVIEALTDAEALQAAKQFNGGLSREVWDRDRLVGRVGPEPSSPSLPS
jgi:hypothetical protein